MLSNYFIKKNEPVRQRFFGIKAGNSIYDDIIIVCLDLWKDESEVIHAFVSYPDWTHILLNIEQVCQEIKCTIDHSGYPRKQIIFYVLIEAEPFKRPFDQLSAEILIPDEKLAKFDYKNIPLKEIPFNLKAYEDFSKQVKEGRKGEV